MALFSSLDSKVELASGFNRSTNLELDFADNRRLRDIFVSEKFAQALLDVFSSIREVNSNERVRVLSGSPGLGKSTFALLLLSILTKKSPAIIREIVKSADSPQRRVLVEAVESVLVGRKTKFVPIFLNGFMGGIEEVFLAQLKAAFLGLGFEKEFAEIVSRSSNHIETIKNWKKNFPKIYEAYVERLEEEELEVDAFERSLKKGATNSLRIFESIHHDMTGGSELRNRSESVVTVYKRACEFLSEQNYCGIFVVYDEFGKYLEQGVHNPSKLNVQFLQDFAEFCDRSGENQCHLTLITHMSVSQYASRLPISVQKEWTKIEGRFQETAFYDRTTNYYSLIAKVFRTNIEQTDKKLYKLAKQFYESFRERMSEGNLGLEGLVTEKNFVEVSLACYPLHPVVLAFLPLLSQKIAQNERTLYTFLTRNEDRSLVSFLKDAHTEALPLLMPYSLYEYFAPLIAKDVGIGGSFRVNLIMESALGKLHADDDCKRQILAIIAMSEVIKNVRLAPATKEFTVSALMDRFSPEEVGEALDQLTVDKTLFFNRIANRYELQQGSSVDIGEEIERLRRKRLTSKELVNIIGGFSETRYIVAKRYNFQNSICRFLRVELISVDQLRTIGFKAQPDFSREDGIIYYVIPFSKDELEDAKKLISERHDKMVIYVVPNSFVECRADIEELNAINELYNNKEVMNSGPLVRKELDRHREITLQAINNILQSLIGQFRLDVEIIYSRSEMRKTLHNFVELQGFLTQVLTKEYSKYIPINSELINKHKVSSNVTLARRSVIDHLIKSPATADIGIEGNGPDKAIFRALRQVANFRWNAESDRFEFDGKSAFAKVFEDYKKSISSDQNGLSYDMLAKKFMAPPYGLRRSVIPLYIALFDRATENKVNHYFDKQYVVDTDGSHYDLMLKHPKSSVIQMTIVSGVQQRYLYDLGKIFQTEGEASVNAVMAAIFKWRKKIPDYTKSASESSDELRKFLIAIDSAVEPDRLVFNKVPEIFGSEAISEKTADQETKALIKRVAQSAKFGIDVYRSLLLRLKLLLLEAIQVSARRFLDPDSKLDPSMDLPIAYQFFFKGLAPRIASHKFTAKTQQFFNRVHAFDTKLPAQYFIETIGDVLTGTSPRHWDAKQESLFSYNLDKVLEEIEQVIASLDPNFQGQSVVAFINKNSGEREYVNLGARLTLKPKHLEVKARIFKELEALSPADKKNILVDIIASFDRS